MRNVVFTIATLGALAACAADTAGDDEADRRKQRDAGTQIVDGGSHQPGDAGTSSADAGSGGSTSGGTVSCYTEGAPSNTCTLPAHCCFANYSAQHNGICTTNSCTWGTIDCDGPEDCASGQHCCSSVVRDSDGITGYRATCQSNACGSPPDGEELCHPGGAACSNNGSCVSTYGANSDLPRTLYICR